MDLDKNKLQVRQHTRDVFFYQVSVKQVFFWRGDTYRKIEGDKAERRTNQAGQQVDMDFMILAFGQDTVVTISNDDVDNLRFKS